MGNTHSAQKTRLEADAEQNQLSASASDVYEWGYGKERGPETWWIYYPAASGDHQSPINISPEEAEHDAISASYPLKVEYPQDDGNKMAWNTGNSLQVEVRSKSHSFYVTGGPLKSTQYELRQFQFHWGEKDDFGSEHTIAGISYAMEIHFVHWNTDLFSSFEEAARCEGGLVILAVLVSLDSHSNSEISELASLTQNISYKRQYENLPPSFDIKRLLPRDTKKYWLYKGSLTSPPCYESVTWMIFYDTLKVSSYELMQLRRLHNHCPNDRPPADEYQGYIIKNNRGMQPIGARKVTAVEHNFERGGAASDLEFYHLYDKSIFTDNG